ncbi:hypothetical protein K438DRAFT_1980510 [Mycena galopus ATCC 62051]|nr:hypothetical protein K438DRAFT_1980510 [Mycena galopus ATCC 62051]
MEFCRRSKKLYGRSGCGGATGTRSAVPLVLESARLILSCAQRHRTTRGGPLPLADSSARTTLTLLLRAETASCARQHRRVARNRHRATKPADESAASLYSWDPYPQPPPSSPACAPHAELDVDSSVRARVRVMISMRRSAGASSTCEPMLGNAGVAPAPTLHMVMPHRKPSPPYSAPGPGVGWDREARGERVTGTARRVS